MAAVPAVVLLAVVGAVAVPLIATAKPGHAARTDATVTAAPPPTAAAVALAQGGAAPAHDSGETTDSQNYTINVQLTGACPVYWNLDAHGEQRSGQPGWVEAATVTEPSGTTRAATVGWRYNVNRRWALIASRRSATPFWGFIDRDCLRDEPTPIRSGHAHGSGWSQVFFRPTARKVAGTRHVRENATVRSEPSGYVIGNLLAAANGGEGGRGDVFELSDHCSTSRAWVFGRAPRANTWGWILARDIGDPCGPEVPAAAATAATAATATATADTADGASPALDSATSAGTTSPAAPPATTVDSPAPAAPAATAAPATEAPATEAPATAAVPPPAAPAPAGGSTATCYPQYTVTDHARARATRDGDPIGDVQPGALVNARSNDGVWMYGYISQINGGAGGFGWLLDEKVDRTGTFCG